MVAPVEDSSTTGGEEWVGSRQRKILMLSYENPACRAIGWEERVQGEGRRTVAGVLVRSVLGRNEGETWERAGPAS